MDVAHTHQSHQRKHRSFNSPNHISLAPLTTRLPLRDDDYDALDSITPYTPPPHTTSYLQGKSAPTTPRLLSHSPGRVRGASAPGRNMFNANGNPIPKSKSTTHLTRRPHHPQSRRSYQNHTLSHKPSSEFSEWLTRAGAAITTEARESKGQGWFVTRDSSTSLAGAHVPSATDDYREQEASYKYGGGGGYSSDEEDNLQMRRGAAAAAAARRSRRNSGAGMASPAASRYGSRYGSAVHSRAASRASRLTPGERRSVMIAEGGEEDYFGHGYTGPDFVNLEDRLEAMGLTPEDLNTRTVDDDMAEVRRLMKQSNTGMISWIGSMFGLGLASVDEDGESESDEHDSGDPMTPGSGKKDRSIGPHATRLMRLDGVTKPLRSEPIDVPPPSEEGGWKDAGWLFTVAAKVLF